MIINLTNSSGTEFTINTEDAFGYAGYDANFADCVLFCDEERSGDNWVDMGTLINTAMIEQRSGLDDFYSRDLLYAVSTGREDADGFVRI